MFIIEHCDESGGAATCVCDNGWKGADCQQKTCTHQEACPPNSISILL